CGGTSGTRDLRLPAARMRAARLQVLEPEAASGMRTNAWSDLDAERSLEIRVRHHGLPRLETAKPTTEVELPSARRDLFRFGRLHIAPHPRNVGLDCQLVTDDGVHLRQDALIHRGRLL